MNVSRLRERPLDDVGLEALGQVLAEPRGFLDRSGADGASDSLGGVSACAYSRICAGLPAAHVVAKRRARGTIAGGCEAAIVIALLAAGSAFAGYPIARAVSDSALIPMARPANAQVTETVTAGGAHAVVETTIRRVERDART